MLSDAANEVTSSGIVLNLLLEPKYKSTIYLFNFNYLQIIYLCIYNII